MSNGNSAYYQNVFHKIYGGKTFTWNWAAFFFGYIWFAYRKMYLISFLICNIYLLFTACVLFSIFLGVEDTVNRNMIVLVSLITIFVLLRLFCGVFGNKLYYDHIQRKIKCNYGLLSVKPVDIISVILLCYVLVQDKLSEHTAPELDDIHDIGFMIGYVIGYNFGYFSAWYVFPFFRWLYETYQLRQLRGQIQYGDMGEKRIIY